MASGRHTKARGNPTFLDLDKAYPNQPFTVLIWGRDRAKFRNPEETYRNKNICVTGRIGSDRDEPEMIISDPTQLTANIEKAEKLQEVWPRYRKPITKAALRRCDSCAVALAFSRPHSRRAENKAAFRPSTAHGPHSDNLEVFLSCPYLHGN